MEEYLQNSLGDTPLQYDLPKPSLQSYKCSEFILSLLFKHRDKMLKYIRTSASQDKT
jgi:hypothetical protein